LTTTFLIVTAIGVVLGGFRPSRADGDVVRERPGDSRRAEQPAVGVGRRVEAVDLGRDGMPLSVVDTVAPLKLAFGRLKDQIG